MVKRSKQTIALEKLTEIGKISLKEPNPTHYLSEDVAVVVSTHHAFLLAVAPLTKRLNPSSLALMGKDLFQMTSREAQQFGDSLSHAFGHCMIAGSKAKTGAKLTKEIHSVYMASYDGKEVKQETKAEPSCIKGERQPLSPERPTKALKTCLSSPSQIALLYSGSSSSVAVKVIFLLMDTMHRQE